MMGRNAGSQGFGREDRDRSDRGRGDRGRGKPGGGGGPRRDQPMLMGEPSPSLAKIRKMSPDELQAKVDQLREEGLRLGRKVQRLQEQDEPNFKKITTLTKQIQRLQALQRICRDRLAGKEPSIGEDQPQRPRRSSRPGGPRRFTARRPPFADGNR